MGKRSVIFTGLEPPKYEPLATQLSDDLQAFEVTQPLPGISIPARRGVLIAQVVDSIRRVDYFRRVRNRSQSILRADPASWMFDPILAAVLRKIEGSVDEAFWFVFLAVHFGKHHNDGWKLCRTVYGSLGEGPVWDWATTSANPSGFKAWLHGRMDQLRAVNARFSNHRQYMSLKATSPAHTGAAFETYVKWVDPPRTHAELFSQFAETGEGDPRRAFRAAYKSMAAVASFGRLGRFDYLSMIGNLELAPLQADSAHISGASGPRRGAALLFKGNAKAKVPSRELEQALAEFGKALKIGMQVVEDSLCNWQKSPDHYKHFRG